jgi:hypothetical protein
MKRITSSLDWFANAILTVALTCLMAGFLTVGAGVLLGSGQCSSIGMAMVGGGSMTALLAACWIHRDF